MEEENNHKGGCRLTPCFPTLFSHEEKIFESKTKD